MIWMSIPGASPKASPPIIHTNEFQQPEKTQDFNNGLSRIIEKETRALEDKGYIPVPEQEVAFYTIDNLSTMLSEPGVVKKKAGFEFSEIKSDLPLNKEGVIGINPFGTKQLISVMHVFTLSENITVTLEETDLVNSGLKVSQSEKMINASVNEYKATITLRKANSGMSLILVSWVTDSRLLKLSYAGPDIDPADKSKVLAIARSVSYQ
jgi:hypothetical protein